VTLVGAGPGDPGLLTLKALRALQRADVVLHDRLVSAEILALARRDADLVDVGKMGGGPSTPQARIHDLLIEHARAGRSVVRLKGGDPFVFGRGGEEVEALRSAGVDVDVIPGITTALALAAAGIPLTHRGLAAGVRLVTAQRSSDGVEPDWKNWAEGRDTLVVYMGTSAIGRLRTELLRHGLSASTPVALVENASRPSQRVVRGQLIDAEDLVATHGIGSPSIVVIGPVAAFAAMEQAA
jgi:uroporphyrin-III C-methyltransferase/precorrin-2 dehydrogenase/sirohydrochlorin ferrochelatase